MIKLRPVRSVFLIGIAVLTLGVGLLYSETVENSIQTGVPWNDTPIAASQWIVQNEELTTLSVECLNFVISEDFFNGNHIVDVRENSSTYCGGDAQTSVRLFSLAIDPAKREVWTDAKSLLGEFEKLELEADIDQ